MKKQPFSTLNTFFFALTLCAVFAFTGCAGKTEEAAEEDTLTEVPADAADAMEDGTTSTFGEELSDKEVEDALLGDDEEKK
ncbi:MAG: hypothetical protein GC205_01780 [Bacteroidetes bacterium]|nr:hypothetical protein [Bacteroidota bacterium]